jgi:predicted NAD/FAD-binding protein
MRMRIAVIGTGVAGLGAAHALRRVHDVEVYERDALPGGHCNTVGVVTEEGRVLRLDTGFIVHNTANYPNLTRLFGELGVATQPSEMSFSVTCRRCGLSYAGRDPWGQRRLVRDRRTLRLLAQITRFLATAGRMLDGRHATRTLGQMCRAEGYSDDLRDHFLVPFTAAIWSMPPGEAVDFPAHDALVFFANHNLLGFRRHTWRTVVGGSRTYVHRLLAPLEDRLWLETPVAQVRREAGRVVVATHAGAERDYDAVVLATHSDQALRLLADPTPDERAVLGDIGYTPSEAVLHTDRALLPPEGATEASWNYLLEDCRDPDAAPTVTYLLNRLQRIDAPERYCLTLNRGDVDPTRVLERMRYEHPRYTFAALRAQARLPEISGADRVWFAGAYHRHGFHEDGLVSGLAAARGLGAPW